jgi:hypothetical protein
MVIETPEVVLFQVAVSVLFHVAVTTTDQLAIKEPEERLPVEESLPVLYAPTKDGHTKRESILKKNNLLT